MRGRFGEADTPGGREGGPEAAEACAAWDAAARERARPRSPGRGLLRPLGAPAGDHPSICPHCWMVNPGPFRLCARCGASMETFLQESAGLRRTAPVQSPVPVGAALSTFQRVVVGMFLLLMAAFYLSHLVPQPAAGAPTAAPERGGP